MQIDEGQIRAIVKQVIEQMGAADDQGIGLSGTTTGQYGQFVSLEDAIQAAEQAQQRLMAESLELRKRMVAAMKEYGVKNAAMLARLGYEETGLGNYEDKIIKNQVAATLTPGLEDLEPIAYTGDHGLTVIDHAPFGVIGSITPTTNPSETVLNNGISMIAAGNAVVFNAHPNAKRVTMKAVELMNQAILSVGGPDNLLSGVLEPTLDTARLLMEHPKIRLLVVTGGQAVVKAAMGCGKKVIAAGPGNPPAVVDETADLVKAARDIVDGASIDNNIPCTAEKVLIVVDQVADELKRHMTAYKAYEINATQLEQLMDHIFDTWRGVGCREAIVNKKYIGQKAPFILSAIGVTVEDHVRLVIAETDRMHPLVWHEQMMPVLPLVRVADVDQAIALAKEVEQGFAHTAIMHSRNVEKLSKMAREINTTLFIKNGPSYAGLGFGGEGFTSWSIAGPTGEGPTTARTFTRPRRCVLVDYFRIV